MVICESFRLKQIAQTDAKLLLQIFKASLL